ncbi:probable cytochrome P450 304a1 isoform X5 [Musca autumnalis]|uniref:probable cytochrome P450 304a1 isoform X5 n=1 Tax=Musca autumnalis TaxID=221902 RepID=UPI003CF2C4D1
MCLFVQIGYKTPVISEMGKRKKLKSRNSTTLPASILNSSIGSGGYTKDHLDAWLETCLKDASATQLSSSSEFLDYNPTVKTSTSNSANNLNQKNLLSQQQQQTQQQQQSPVFNMTNMAQQQHQQQAMNSQQQQQQQFAMRTSSNPLSNNLSNSNSYNFPFSQGFQRPMPNFMKPSSMNAFNNRYSMMFPSMMPGGGGYYPQNDGSQDFASLPPMVNIMGGGGGSGGNSSEHENNSTDVLDGSASNPNISRGFRFSDPCLLNPSDNDSKMSGQNTPDRRNNLPSDMDQNNKFFNVLMEQIQLLHETNSKICRDLHEAKAIPRMPFFGSYLLMMLANFRYLHKGVWKFAKWLKSDIIGLHMGPYPIVVVHNAEGVREVLNRKEFDGRPALLVAQIREPSWKIAGIFFKDGPEWAEQRRFILRYLRDFGFGRRFQELELVIQEEITDMINLIRNGPQYEHEKQFIAEGGYRILMPYFFSPFSANSVYHIVFNERYPRNEQAELWKLIRLGVQFQRKNDDYGKLVSIMPWIRHIFPNWSSYNQLMESNTYMYNFYEKLVDRHIETYDESSERNFVDLYIREMKKAEMEGTTDTTSFKHNQFVMGLLDFTFPAFTAVGMQLSFLVQYFLLYPEVQKKIQKEIDSVVGGGRLPNLNDRKDLHYTEATVREILRIETLVPSNVPHRAQVDTELMGYSVPKDTLVLTSLYAFHNDERVWGDPQNFRPERFLDENGKLCLKKDVSLPFGAGKRLCAGETFARNMLFLMTAAMCQNFNFVLGPNDKLPDLSTNLSGLSTSPRDFWVQLEDRT